MAERNDLGQAMISLVRDLEPGLLLLVSALCYVLALFAFALRAAADGKPDASGPKAFAHMAGGIAAWHIVAVIEAVQTSLGIAVLNIR